MTELADRAEVVEQPEPDAPALDAATAFENMRRQLALLTAATEGFAARHAAVEARDYGPDIARLAGAMERTHKAINTLNDRPGVALTPEIVTAQIEAAAAPLRRADQEMLGEAAQALGEATQRIDAIVGRARTREKQFDALIWAVMGGTIFVIALFALAGALTAPRDPAPVANAQGNDSVEQRRQQ